MRFLKQSQLNSRNVKDLTVSYDINGQVIMDTTNSLLIPKGTTLERPLSPTTGHFRFNTTSNEFEVYQGGAWRSLRFKESVGITQQAIGTGDDIETKFGPLNPAPPTTVASGDSWSGANLIILIDET